MWLEWHDYWFEKVKTSSIPIFFFRFEDLLVKPVPVLKDMFKYILGKEDLDGTVIEHRIHKIIKTGKNFLYKPRSAGGGLHKHADKIDDAQMKSLMDKLEYYLHFFGYAKDLRPGESELLEVVDANGNTYPKFDFYDYKGKAKKENTDSYMDFIKVNERTLKQRLTELETGKVSTININEGSEGIWVLG